MAGNVNNLNVYTFIREIYQSLKHLDTQLYTLQEQVMKRMDTIEQSQNILKSRFDTIEILLQKNLETHKSESSLNKNIETELLNKMAKLNTATILDNNKKIELKPEELTFANVLENDYTFDDINNQLINNDSKKIFNGYRLITDLDLSFEKKDDNIENLLF